MRGAVPTDCPSHHSPSLRANLILGKDHLAEHSFNHYPHSAALLSPAVAVSGCGQSAHSAGPFEELRPFTTPLGNTQVRMSFYVGGTSWARCEVRAPSLALCQRMGRQDRSTNSGPIRTFPNRVVHDGIVHGGVVHGGEIVKNPRTNESPWAQTTVERAVEAGVRVRLTHRRRGIWDITRITALTTLDGGTGMRRLG